MAIKVIVLGRPGSGKTTASHYIAMLLRDKGWSAIHINDYEILQEMFQADKEHKKFLPTEHGGFDVLDFSVLDTALKAVEKKVQECLSFANLITIEFARDDYREALKQFSRNFLGDCYFLFIDADVDICLQRIHERVTHPTTIGDHPSLSDDHFRIYYGKDNRSYITCGLEADCDLEDRRVEIIDNMSSYKDFEENLEQFVKMILQKVPISTAVA